MVLQENNTKLRLCQTCFQRLPPLDITEPVCSRPLDHSMTLWRPEISSRHWSQASWTEGLFQMNSLLQYQTSSATVLAWSVKIAAILTPQSPQYNARTGHIEFTQCYVRQQAVICRSALDVFVHTQQYQEHQHNAYSVEIDRKQSPSATQVDPLLWSFLPVLYSKDKSYGPD